MQVNFQREANNDEEFVINWPDSQIRFYLIRRDDSFDRVKEAVYVLMDKFRTQFYIGETGPSSRGGIRNRFQTHKWKRDFWHCALVIEDRNGEFKMQDVRKWFEWRLNEIAKARSQEDKKYEIVSSAGKQDPKPWLENRIEIVLAVCRFLGIPWGYASEKSVSRKDGHKMMAGEKRTTTSAHVQKTGRAPSFSYALAGVPEGAELTFVEAGLKVRARGRSQVEYKGACYSLTGFVRKFIPDAKRNKAEAYQGPAFFTYQGVRLTELREKLERVPSKCMRIGKIKKSSAKDVCASGLSRTQLAKEIARKVDGREGAANGILQYFSRFKRCVESSKWRKPLESAGIKFDSSDFVVDWRTATVWEWGRTSA